MRTMFTVQQRYLDRTQTQPMPEHFNVFADGEYIGYVWHNTGRKYVRDTYIGTVDRWEWSAPEPALFERFDRETVIDAVMQHVG